MRRELLFALFCFPCAAQTVTLPGIWERRAPFPIEATEVSAAALDGKIYALCGLTATGNSDALYIYDPRVDAWSRGAAIPIQNGADHYASRLPREQLAAGTPAAAMPQKGG